MHHFIQGLKPEVARKVGVLAGMSVFAENINTILCNF